MHHKRALSLLFRRYGLWLHNQVFHLSIIFFYYLIFCLLNMWMTLFPFYFSFFTVSGLSYCVGVPFNLPFCTKMWAYECVGFHRHLFINGISLGTSFELLMDLKFILLPTSGLIPFFLCCPVWEFELRFTKTFQKLPDFI